MLISIHLVNTVRVYPTGYTLIVIVIVIECTAEIVFVFVVIVITACLVVPLRRVRPLSVVVRT